MGKADGVGETKFTPPSGIGWNGTTASFEGPGSLAAQTETLGDRTSLRVS